MLVVGLSTNANLIGLEFTQAARDMQQQAAARALNKMADQAKTAAAREVRSAGYNLKASVIKAQMRVKRATPGQLTASVVASGRPIPLIQYGARQTGRGVSVSVQKGRKVIAGAFIATMRSGHVGVYVRESGGKHVKVKKGGKASWHELPIRQLFGPSVPDALANKAVQDALQTLVAEKLPRLIEHEHAWLRKKLGR